MTILDTCRQIIDTESGRVLLYRDEVEAVLTSGDTISRRQAIDALSQYPFEKVVNCISIIEELPSAQSEEVIPHRNYKYLSDYWCECGWHLGKKGEVKYCSECGRRVNWDG